MKKLLSLILTLCLIMTCAAAFAATYEGMTQEEFNALEATTVVKSDDSPTGYYVTFRYKDPDATRVRIYGEWSFSDPALASFVTSENASPDEWEDGDIVWKTSSWPTADMALNEETGVWSYTIPLPTGTWCYRYYVGGVEGAELTDYTDAVMVADPANVNYLADPNEVGGEQLLTAVYVPYDEVKQAKTITRFEEAPRDGENGTVEYETVTLESGLTTSYAIYLPYEYDAQRDDAYPMLILFHGGGGYYGSWFTNGMVNILDNMIAEGRLEPTIVVTPCGQDFPDPNYSWDRPALLDYVLNTIIPNMTEKYNASDDPARRAFAGLSMGGATTAYTLFNHTEEFDTYIMLSAPFLGDIQPDFTMPELKEKNLFPGYGDYDFVVTRSLYHLEPDADGNLIPLMSAKSEGSTFEYVVGLNNEGVEIMTVNYPYGHDWVLWRKLMVKVFDDVLWK
ncbi:MAG: alpha/beta hydrolase-fold protein [Clostridia bacterium]|nr:alpha/beta hydrolase-fold protein [Clostridia bacterium]